MRPRVDLDVEADGVAGQVVAVDGVQALFADNDFRDAVGQWFVYNVGCKVLGLPPSRRV